MKRPARRTAVLVRVQRSRTPPIDADVEDERDDADCADAVALVLATNRSDRAGREDRRDDPRVRLVARRLVLAERAPPRRSQRRSRASGHARSRSRPHAPLHGSSTRASRPLARARGATRRRSPRSGGELGVFLGRRCCRAPREHSAAGSADRSSARRAARIAAQLLSVAAEPLGKSHVRRRLRRHLARPGAARRRGSTDRRPGRCRSRRPGIELGAIASGIAAGACVQYDRHFVASTTPGSSSAPVGHASMQSVHEPQSSSSGGVARSRRRDERPEHDPRAVPPRDQHRVLAVEADAGADGALAVDVLVRVDEHAVVAAEPAAELVQPLAQGRVAVPTTCSAGAVPRRAGGSGSGA